MYASDVLSSVKQWVFDPWSKEKEEKSCPSGNNGSLLLSRSVKCLALGGLAVSLGAIEGVAEKTVGVARFSGNVPTEPANPCMQGIIGGGVGSLLVQSPLPLLMGLGGCLPGGSAQQRVGNEFQVNSYTASIQKFPSVASFNNGNFVVIWYGEGQGGNFGAYGQLFNGNANRIGNEFQVHNYTTSFQGFPSVAVFTDDNFVVTWSSSDVYAQLFYRNGTNISNEFQVNTYTPNNQYDISIASFANDNFVVVWNSDGQDGSDEGVYGQLFDGNANRVGSEFQVNNYTNSYQRFPSVASFINGNFVVTWESDGQDGAYAGIYGQLFYGNGTEIGNEFQINTYTDRNQQYPSAASFINGNFVVAWRSFLQDGSGYGVYGQLFDGNANRIGNEFQANTYTTDYQIDPSVIALNNNNFVIAWESDGQDGSLKGIYGQLFDGNANRIGNEFQINTYTAGDQIKVSLSGFDNNNFVVVWESDGQDGSSEGIYGQIFESPLITSITTSSTSELTTSSSLNMSGSDTTTSSQPSGSSSTTSGQQSSSTSGVMASSSSNILSRTSNLSNSSSTDTATLSQSSNPSSSISNQINSSSNLVSTTTAMINSSVPITTAETVTSTSGTSSAVWISLGLIGGVLCICLAGGSVYALKRRKKKQDVEKDSDFILNPVIKIGHKEIGGKYYQLSKITENEAEEIYEQTGHIIMFPKGEEKLTYVIGRGKFGTIKVAKKIEDNEYVVSKKVKGLENMNASKEEANLQKEAEGKNILPIYNTIELEGKALYHFMPLAGYGNGIEIQKQLSAMGNSTLATEISKFIAKDLLTGFQTIHKREIYHLDIKPENIVFDKSGTAYITDFGCARKEKEVSCRALGDNRYFSPERLKACKESNDFDAESADMWAVGVTLLQMIKGMPPYALFSMPLDFTERVQMCTEGHFRDKLDQFKELKDPVEGSIWWVIKGLLDPNAESRLTAKKALKASCFKGLNEKTKADVFEDMRADKFVQRGMKRENIKMGNYHFISQEIAKTPFNDKGSEYANTMFKGKEALYANYPEQLKECYANIP